MAFGDRRLGAVFASIVHYNEEDMRPMSLLSHHVFFYL